MDYHVVLNKAAYILAAIAMSFIFLYSCFSIGVKIISPDTYEVVSLSDGWTDEEGRPFALNSFHITDEAHPVSQTIKYVLTVDRQDMCLLFRARNMYVDVYANGELISMDKTDQDVMFGTSPGSRWHIVSLDTSTPTITIELVGTACYTNTNGLIDSIYAGSAKDVYRITTTGRLAGFILSLFLQTLGLGLMILYAYLHRRFTMGKDLLYLGIAAFFSAQWCSAESQMWQLFFGYSEVFHLLGYLSLISIPIPFCLLANFRIKEPRKNTYATFLAVIAGINLLVVTPLHILGIFEFHYSLYITHAIIIFMLPVIVWLILSYMSPNSGNDKKKLVYLALIILVICVLITMIKYNFGTYSDYTLYIRVAIVCFLFCLIVFQLNQVARLFANGLKADMLHELALTDYLTGLYNRTAFAEHKKLIYDSLIESKTPIGIIQFDVNNLKSMNDTFGHEEGDKLLCTTAKGLTHCFGDTGKCYRMGGDEFMVILTGDSPYEDYEKGIDALKKYCRGINSSSELPLILEIAHGFVLNQGQPMEEAIKAADERMYRNKRELKHIQ